MIAESILIGILSISSIGLKEPVFIEPDHTECVDSMKVCAYAGYPRTIAAHDYGAFSRLNEMEVGDRFRFARKVYRVDRIKLVNENDVGALIIPEGKLSMQTCTANPRVRLFILSSLIP
jgi:LPXTG-site transpeptidase (sortase) family protein